MCGLAGWLGEPKLPKGQRLARARALEGLLVANSARGTDASGVCTIHQSRPETIYKRAVDSCTLVMDDQLGSIIRAKDATMILGHTRLGTMGKNENRNAHPFKEGNVIGTHNGMVFNYSELDQAIDGYKPLRVDSQVIFRLLSEVVPDGETYAQALPMIKGSLALAWHDTRDPTGLWMFKHSNPISMAFAPTAKTAFWSSEYAHLAVIMQSVYGNNWEMVTLKSDNLYRLWWDGKDLMWSQWQVEMPQWTSTVKPTLSALPQTKKSEDKPMSLNNITTTPSGEIDWDNKMQDCELCGGMVDWDDDYAFYDHDTDSVACGPCGRWWENSGSDLYVDLKEAKSSGHFGRETFYSREPAENSLSTIHY